MRKHPCYTAHNAIHRWVGWAVGEAMAIDLGKDRSYCKTGQCIPFAVGSAVGEAKEAPQNYS